MKDIDLTERRARERDQRRGLRFAESKHHDAATAARAARAITCRPRLTLNVLKH
jgi:hypothetical protein